MTTFGILVSPCQVRIEMPECRVMVVEDRELGTNDCRGWIARSVFNRLKLPDHRFYQFRLAFEKTQAKGSFKGMEDDCAEQMAEILSACDNYGNKARGGKYTGPENACRIRAFVLLLRHSGFRIGDGVTLERSRIIDNKLFLYTAKTGTPVYCLLPPFVLDSLAAVPKVSESYFFWTGESRIESGTGDWQRTLKAVFRLAGIPDGHAHRFRDTFAVGLLQAGVPMERGSVLLGHSSIKVTEKHYSPWVRARQEELEADVRRTREQALSATKGTLEVHEAMGRINWSK